MIGRKDLMSKFLRNFDNNEDYLQKYIELLLLRDEKSAYSYIRPEKMRKLNIAITSKCNLNCVWCHRDQPEFKDTSYLQKEMPFELLKKLLLNSKGFKRIHLCGIGEPLTYSRISDAVKEAKKYVNEVLITTNGTLLVKRYAEEFAESGLTGLEVSIDGFDGETNYKFRGSREDKIIGYLEYLSKISNIPIQINSVLADANYESLFGAIDKLKNVRNLKKLHVIPIFMQDRLREMNIGRVTDEQMKQLLDHYKNRIEALGLVNIDIYPNLAEAELDPIITLREKHNICYYPHREPFINIYGHMAPCPFLEQFSCGSVVDRGLEDTWNGSELLKWRSTQLAGHYCEECQNYCNVKDKGEYDFNLLPGYKNKGEDPVCLY
jgi:MoaA/NifB/PqqE/SkfB family radical SAM enzyme